VRAERLIITGRVQGVGYRDWLVAEATRLGLTGWVRNLGHDQVEAVLCGADGAVEEAVALCRQGPGWARVAGVQRFSHEAAEYADFRRLASA
jgi:acylphosphatase